MLHFVSVVHLAFAQPLESLTSNSWGFARRFFGLALHASKILFIFEVSSCIFWVRGQVF